MFSKKVNDNNSKQNKDKAVKVKKSGKVEHSDKTHDDNVFSYLMALYVWYEGKNLVENFGIRKSTLRTDDNQELEENGFEESSGCYFINKRIQCQSTRHGGH